MSEVKYGTVSVVLPKSVVLPEKSGKMQKREVSRLLKAPHGMALAAEHSASALEKIGSSFTPPSGVTPESLRESGTQSEEMTLVIHHVKVVLQKLMQGKLLIDHQTHLQLRKLKDQVRAQAKYDPSLLIPFDALLTFFEKPAETRKANRARARKAQEVSVQAPEATHNAQDRSSLNLVKLPEVGS